MALPEFVRFAVDKHVGSYCENKVPPHVRDQLAYNYKVRGNNVSLIESRPHFQDKSRWIDIPFAQLRFDADDLCWTVYCSDRNGRWHLYDLAKPSSDLGELLAEITRDPTGIFFG